MKKGTKIIALVLAAVLLVGATVFGTMAYLTSKATVTNTFTVGNVAITLDEAKVDANGKKITGEGAERVKTNGYKLIPGMIYDKDPTVTVKADSEPAYVRMLVTINKKTALDEIGFVMTEVFDGYESSKWGSVGNGKHTDPDSMTYEFRYFETVGAPEDDVVLPALFNKLIIPADLTNEELASLAGLKINIEAQAIQAAGFDNADAAWGSFPLPDVPQ